MDNASESRESCGTIRNPYHESIARLTRFHVMSNITVSNVGTKPSRSKGSVRVLPCPTTESVALRARRGYVTRVAFGPRAQRTHTHTLTIRYD